LILWRFDEGKGCSLEDLSDFSHPGVILNFSADVWEEMEEGQPMELEDEWGKKCPAQFVVRGIAGGVESTRKVALEELKAISVWMWVKTEG
jgi:hypothetical protein